MVQTLVVLELLAGAFLLLLGMVVLALGAWAWSRAIAAAHQAHAHGLQVQETRETLSAANDAVEEVRERARATWTPPPDDELVEAIIAERAAGRNGGAQQMEFTTLGNEGIEETEPIPSGSFYRTGSQG